MDAMDLRLPLHARVKDAMLRRLADRQWRTGEALPGEDRLAAEFEISVGTMRKVIQSLVQDGILERVHGKGTFVTSTYERSSMLRFVRFREPGSSRLPDAHILKLAVVKADAEISKRLQVKGKTEVIYLHRSRSYDEEVILVEHIWLPFRLFSQLVPYLESTSPALLYPVYDEICGVRVSRAVDELEVSEMSPTDAKVFKVARAAPCMRIQRTMRDIAGDIVEWRTSYVPADRFHYTVEIR